MQLAMFDERPTTCNREGCTSKVHEGTLMVAETRNAGRTWTPPKPSRMRLCSEHVTPFLGEPRPASARAKHPRVLFRYWIVAQLVEEVRP